MQPRMGSSIQISRACSIPIASLQRKPVSAELNEPPDLPVAFDLRRVDVCR
jgi:hypothetical protein